MAYSSLVTSWVAHPQGLLLVHQAPRVGDFLHGLLLLLLLFFLLVILLDLLDVGIVILVLVGLVIGDVLLGGVLDP